MGSAHVKPLIKWAEVLEVEDVVVDWNIVSAHLCGNIPAGALEERITKDTAKVHSLPPKAARLIVKFHKLTLVRCIFKQPICHLVQVVLQERKCTIRQWCSYSNVRATISVGSNDQWNLIELTSLKQLHRCIRKTSSSSIDCWTEWCCRIAWRCNMRKIFGQGHVNAMILQELWKPVCHPPSEGNSDVLLWKLS